MQKNEYDNITKALAIYRNLLESEQGYIEKRGNEELFADYQDQGVNEALHIICNSMQVRTFRGKGGRLYIVSEEEGMYAINESEVKTYFYDAKKDQPQEKSERGYLFYYATLILLDEFFGGNPIRQRRNYIPLNNWIQAVDAAVERHKELTLEEEAELGFNFIRVGRRWKCFSTENDDVVAGINTKAGFLERCVQFLTREELIISSREDELRIYPTEKLIDLVERGNLRTERLSDLLFATNDQDE